MPESTWFERMKLRLFKSEAQRSRRAAQRRLKCELLESRRVLATFAVTTTNDSVAVDLNSGLDANGQISLRSAINAANHAGGDHTIVLSSLLPYSLSIPGRAENFAATGDLDIRSNITITSEVNSIIDAQLIDRVFDVQGNGSLTLEGLQVVNGHEVQGGAIMNRGSLQIRNSNIQGTAGQEVLSISNAANSSLVTVITPVNAYGGAIFNAASGTLNILNSRLDGIARAGDGVFLVDAAGGRGGNAYGGAIFNLGEASLFNVEVFGTATGGSGAEGAAGAAGVAAANGSPATAGAPGFNGGAGGLAYGGGIVNGATGTIAIGQTTIQASAFGGFGGRGGTGGQGGGADAVNLLPAALPGPGGRGGSGGVAFGGGIYNVGGDVSFTSGDQGSSLIQSRAVAGPGGEGGTGGTGGSGAIDLSNEIVITGSNGASGGIGGNGGAAQGGGIHVVSGTVQLGLTRISGLASETNSGAYAGDGGLGGQGGTGADVYVSPGNGNGGSGAQGGRGGIAEGGAVYVKSGIVQMTDGEIQQLFAEGGDAGGHGLGGSAPLGQPGSTVNGVIGSAAFGGGFAIRGGEVTIQRSAFRFTATLGGYGGSAADGLTAGSGAVSQGGAIMISAGTLLIDQTTVDQNYAFGGQGGFANENSFGVVGTDGGTAGNGQGGGLAALGGNVTIASSTFSGNRALGGLGSQGSVGTNQAVEDPNVIGGDGGRGGLGYGGGIYATAANVDLFNVTLYGNEAAGGAGGQGGPARIIEEVPQEPFGLDGGDGLGRGGALYHAGTGLVRLESVSVVRNQVSSSLGSDLGSGGGLFNASGVVQVHNTLIALNALSPTMTSSSFDAVGDFTSLGYNIISVRNAATGFTAIGDRRGISTAPLNVQLDVLQFNGGLTETVALLFSSIAIDAGDPNSFLPFDQDGRPRFGRADIGAFEYIPQLF